MAQDEANTFSKSYDPIKVELENWDPIRGPWLASSLEAISKKEPVPDRTFPEDVTPAQMVELLPNNTRSAIEKVAISNTSTDQSQWSEIRRVVVRPNRPTAGNGNNGCGTRIARSYGDPHIQSFDGARYSFQTVGEFVLTRSSNGMEVQTRQKASGDDISLNTAVAMNVGGDRVGIYAADNPDGRFDSPVRVNGRAIDVDPGKAYFLTNGGTITRTGSQYLVSWPTGEIVTATIRNSGRMAFMNVVVSISECGTGFYDGLLGNANGIERDDFQGMNDVADLRIPNGGDVFGGGRELEQRRLAFLANSMADQYRVSQLTSLFEYPIGTSTFTFTDRSFPRYHRTVDDLSQSQREAARRNCEQQGITGRDLNACIYDNGHVGIEPTPPPVVPRPTDGVELRPLPRPVVNSNPNSEARLRPVPTDEEVIQTEPGKKPKYTPIPADMQVSPENQGGATADPIGRTNPSAQQETPQNVESSGSNTRYGGATKEVEEPTTPTPSTPSVRSTPAPVPSTPKPSTPRVSTPKPSTPKPSVSKPSTPKPSAPKPSAGGRRGG